MKFPSFLIKHYKILYVSSIKIIASKGYQLFISEDCGITWQYWSKIKWNKYSFFSSIRILVRLTRSEISALYCLTNGDYICIAKKGIYKFNPISSLFIRVKKISRGSRPLHLAIDNNDSLYFGDYFLNKKREIVNIYCSNDYGKTWMIVYSFPIKSIKHIHGVFFDKFDEKLWVTTGDNDGECIIGYSEDKFQTIKELYKGGQNYRAVKLLFYKDYILFGTDSPFITNKIYKIHRVTNKLEMIFTVQGSVIDATKLNDFAVFSTTVEPSKINTDQNSYIWQYDGKNEWECIASYKKDLWNMTLFQLGNVQFPVNDSTDNWLYFSGHSLKGIDGNSVAQNIS